jgi:chemotaxis protein MotB
MPKQIWLVAAALTGLVLIGLLGYNVYQGKGELENSRLEMEKARASIEAMTHQSTGLKEEVEKAKQRIQELEKANEQATKMQKSMEDEMRTALESKEVTISQLQGRLTVNILDRILFDSGEAVIKPEGEAVLTKIAEVLAQFPNRPIQVVGHTDNVPIRMSAHARYPSNWELSAARATAAVRFLGEKTGVSPQRLAAVGYGEFHPVADNATMEGRSKNRRIELIILPEEFPTWKILHTDSTNAVEQIRTNLPAPSTNKVETNSTSAVSQPKEAKY